MSNGQTVAEQLAAMLQANGIDLESVAKAMGGNQANKPRKQSVQPVNNGNPNRKAIRQQAKADKQQNANNGTGASTGKKSKYNYGQAPCGQTPRDTHNLRMHELENKVPGIQKVCYIYSVGKDAAGNFTKTFQQMVNNPWTWIYLPSGKRQEVGNMKADAVRQALAESGYGYSQKNEAWACDSSGKPCYRRGGNYHTQQVGLLMRDDD